ncbi:TonB-dependent receptor [Lewinella sp. 4G2]|uniref:SusC/RagA family TonB-linked outer membrane protein n=1 Tax=Lewinella sp. 4G2 TaxID=1803372 RepID=UPI0007B4C612|nr:TonB-dependent receptor [Lewinella sp. 4G2]OAV45950.1 hypothetical protein A3850_018810 [Lewinella sp. 4G2]
MQKLYTKGVAFAALLLLLSATVAAQITGTVTDADGFGLPGVNVVVKGTTTGTVTDVDGSFSLNAPSDATLRFSYLGFATQEIAVGGRSNFDVQLVEDANVMNEVVVVGYGTQRRSDAVGAISSAGQEEFGDVAAAQASELITGKLAGVQVVSNGGVPGSGTNIVVRGIGSFVNASPLYVIDGIQASSTLFNQISPSDIESITVLKDASSIAIYGSSAANGVVLVTTKRARTGAPQVNYNGYAGIAQPWRKLDLMNADQYFDLAEELIDDIPSTAPLLNELGRTDRTDWQDETFRNGLVHENTLNITGGTDNVTYSVTGSYLDQEAISGDFNFQRANVRLSLNENIGSRIRLGQTLFFTNEKRDGRTADFGSVTRQAPQLGIFDETNPGGFTNVTNTTFGADIRNPIAQYALVDEVSRTNRTYFQFFGELDILKGLTFRSQASIEYSNFASESFQFENVNAGLTNPNEARESIGNFYRPLVENILTYELELGDIHRVSALVGNTWSDGQRFRNYSLVGSDFPNTTIPNLGAAQTQELASSPGYGAGALLSYFGRVRYSLMDRYNIEFSMRRDGVSQVFEEGNRFGNFPGVGVSWEVHEEPFFNDAGAVSSLALRASWGKSGNSNIRPFTYLANVFRGGNNNVGFTFGDGSVFTPGASVSFSPTVGLKWEETTQTDIGVTASFWDYALTLDVDVYRRNNEDLLVNVPIATSTGFGTPGQTANVPANAASAVNKGIELSLGYNGNAGSDFNYYFNVNGAYNDNEVTSLGSDDATPIRGGGAFGIASTTITDVGTSIGAFYGYVVEGIAITQAQVDELNAGAPNNDDGSPGTYQAGFAPGDYIYADLDGDGQITSEDQQVLGSPLPDFIYGASFGASYKGFDLAVSLQGTQGVETWNFLDYNLANGSRLYNSYADFATDRYIDETSVNAIYPKVGQNATNDGNLRQSSRYIEDGDFLRVRNLTLGYTLDNDIFGGITRNLRVYVTAQNLLTITDYDGYDPEVSSNGSFLFGRGVDTGQFPQPRTFLFGIQAGF